MRFHFSSSYAFWRCLISSVIFASIFSVARRTHVAHFSAWLCSWRMLQLCDIAIITFSLARRKCVDIWAGMWQVARGTHGVPLHRLKECTGKVAHAKQPAAVPRACIVLSHYSLGLVFKDVARYLLRCNVHSSSRFTKQRLYRSSRLLYTSEEIFTSFCAKLRNNDLGSHPIYRNTAIPILP